MKPSLRVFLLAFLFASALFAQTETVTITKLAAGSYTVSSAAGTQLVRVSPLGNGSYMFFSPGGSSTLMTLAPGMYTLTSSDGVNLGTTYINSLGSGRYSFSNPTTGTTGTVQSLSAPQGIPLPALAVQPPNTTNLYILAAMVRQQCNARGGVLYKPHWYSKMRCETPAQIEAEAEAKDRKKQSKQPTP
jgi:hypothetical protein